MKKMFIVFILCLLSVAAFSQADNSDRYKQLNADFMKSKNKNHIFDKFEIDAFYDKTDNIFYAKGITEDKIEYYKQGLYDIYSYENNIKDYIIDFKNKMYSGNENQLMSFFVNNMLNNITIYYSNYDTVKFNLSKEDIYGCNCERESVYSLTDEEIKDNFFKYNNDEDVYQDKLYCYGFLKMDLSEIVKKFAQNAYKEEIDIINKNINLKTIGTDYGELKILAPKESIDYTRSEIGKAYKENEKYYKDNGVKIGTDGKLYNKNGLITSVALDVSEFNDEFECCVYPRIRIPSGDVVYSPITYLNAVEKSYASYIDKNDQETINTRLENNPLIIKAYGVAGISGSMCDIVLSENDACLYINYMKHMHIVAKYDMLKHANYLTEKYNDIPHFLFAENVTDLRGNTIQNSGDSSNGRSVFCVIYSAISDLFNPKKPVCKIL